MNRLLAPFNLRRLSHVVVSATAAASLTAVSMPPAKALPLGDLIFRGIQVMQFSSLSDRQQVEIGNQMHRSLTSRGIQLHRGQAANTYVNQIGQRLVALWESPQVSLSILCSARFSGECLCHDGR